MVEISMFNVPVGLTDSELLGQADRLLVSENRVTLRDLYVGKRVLVGSLCGGYGLARIVRDNQILMAQLDNTEKKGIIVITGYNEVRVREWC